METNYRRNFSDVIVDLDSPAPLLSSISSKDPLKEQLILATGTWLAKCSLNKSELEFIWRYMGVSRKEFPHTGGIRKSLPALEQWILNYRGRKNRNIFGTSPACHLHDAYYAVLAISALYTLEEQEKILQMLEANQVT